MAGSINAWRPATPSIGSPRLVTMTSGGYVWDRYAFFLEERQKLAPLYNTSAAEQ
ncbi:unnamed protein product, partial [Scytosiphon promiscuus]